MMKYLVRNDGFLIAYSPEIARNCPELEIVSGNTIEEIMAIAQRIAEAAPTKEAAREELISIEVNKELANKFDEETAGRQAIDTSTFDAIMAALDAKGA